MLRTNGGTIALARRRTHFIQKPIVLQRIQGLMLGAGLLALSTALVFLMTRSPVDWPWNVLSGEPLP